MSAQASAEPRSAEVRCIWCGRDVCLYARNRTGVFETIAFCTCDRAEREKARAQAERAIESWWDSPIP